MKLHTYIKTTETVSAEMEKVLLSDDEATQENLRKTKELLRKILIQSFGWEEVEVSMEIGE